MLIVEQYYRTGLLAYVWSKYLWQQILEKRQRNVLDTYKFAPRAIREIVKEEEYERRRVAALQRSTFEIIKRTLDVGFTTTLILFEGFRKIWEKSSEILDYLNIRDSGDILKNALFLTLLTSGVFLVTLPFTLLDIHWKRDPNQQAIFVNILLDHAVAQTLLFPFVCIVITGFKICGRKSMLFGFIFVELQVLSELLLENESTKTLQDDELRRELTQLTRKYNFPLQDIWIVQRSRDKKLVNLRGFPTANTIVLSKDLTPDESSSQPNDFTIEEVKSLVSRELNHWNRNHFLINFIVDQIHLCLRFYTMHRLLNSQAIYEAFGFENKPIAVGLVLLQFCPFFDLYNFVVRIINRRLEFVVDDDVKRLQDDVSLRRAVIKIADKKNSFPVQDPLYSACLNSEASCYERINALN